MLTCHRWCDVFRDHALGRSLLVSITMSITASMLFLSTLLTASVARCETWEALPPLPDREGFAGMFAGVSGQQLLAVGGANFPEKRPWEGGTKVWYDTIYALERDAKEWQIPGKLPLPLGYGVSATSGEAMIIAGGSSARGHHRETLLLTFKNDRVEVSQLAPLPIPIANSCGALVGEWLVVAGGLETPDARAALTKVYALDLAHKNAEWLALDDLPGPGRMLAMAAAVEGRLYVIGGTALVEDAAGKVSRSYLHDGYVLDCRALAPGATKEPRKPQWQPIAKLPEPIAAAPSPLPVQEGQLFVLGGDDGSHVSTTPDQHPGFRTTALRYTIAADRWDNIELGFDSRVTTSVTRWNDRWIIPSGEARPGVRSPRVFGFSPPSQE
ncbi:Kelch repeat-containing protein [Pirellula staleyi DSM 6068]|uniref:Kelch repeat-containing protein n=1 Tax=Pirellula staleyi (strain ATCC 27377 / DSM 6068 / ICPB 4128) TaxID=530564 RepID=D2QW41_PIRSD|nr:Kelch repeat-containing protein [Pirellula staleyi DSM 6068]